MDNEKLKRANELAEKIQLIKDFLEAFPEHDRDFVQCQIKISYNAPGVCSIIERTIWAGNIPLTFSALEEFVKSDLSQYEKEFNEL